MVYKAPPSADVRATMLFNGITHQFSSLIVYQAAPHYFLVSSASMVTLGLNSTSVWVFVIPFTKSCHPLHCVGVRHTCFTLTWACIHSFSLVIVSFPV